VRDCLVVGVPDERFGEAVAAVVAAEDGVPVDVGAVLDHSNLARFKRPRHVVLVDDIRRGPNGKADYAWARDTARAAVDSDEG
jgi:fatty-acyl-CoA synthase